MFATLMTVVAVLGVSRVWLSVEATRASMDADLLRDSIRAERYEGDMLEVRESALGSPSRIRAIAGKAMDMAPAASVSYLTITDEQAATKPAASPPRTAEAGAGLKRVLSNVLDLTAGEAQVLLVGDVGLASTR
jgi:cell division protein FtsL